MRSVPTASVSRSAIAMSVVSSARRSERHAAIARSLGEEVREKRGTWYPPYLSIDDAIDAAYATRGPVVVADPTDNAGGGAASDNTNIVRRLIERGMRDAAIGPVWDPVAVEFCHAAGLGATLPLRFGGKAAASSGEPVDAEATVIGLVHAGQQTFGSARMPFGDAAGIRVGGVEIVLNAHRTQAFGTELFSSVGIDLSTKRYIGVKSTNHFYAGFAPVATQVLYCDGEGPQPLDARKFPFRRITRPLWPHDELPV